MTRKDITQAIVLFVVIAGFLIGLGAIQHRLDEQQKAITCVSAEANISQLAALREISDQLGVPVTFQIPEVPAECDGH
jgi:hypothetical protein